MKKTIITATATLLMAAPQAFAGDFPVTKRGLDREISLCVAEIGRHADYDGGERIVHKVLDAEQKNLAEREFSIDTLVYADEAGGLIRQYQSRCVTKGALKVVRFDVRNSTQ